MKWFELIRHKYGCETVMLHVPYQGEGKIAPNMRDYVVKQLKETVIPTLERISGVKFDIDRLRQYMRESAKAEEDLVAVLQSAKNRPSPIDGYFGAVYYIGPIFTAFRGMPEATEYYRVLRQEIEQRVREGKGPITPDGEMGEEKYRLVVEGPPNWTSFRDFWKMFYDEGAVVVASTYSKVGGVYDFGFRHDPDHPLESLADYCLGCYTNLNLPSRIDMICKYIDEYQADGLLINSIKSCNSFSAGQLLILREVEKRTGKPAAFIETDLVDPRYFSAANVKNRLESYFQMVKQKRVAAGRRRALRGERHALLHRHRSRLDDHQGGGHGREPERARARHHELALELRHRGGDRQAGGARQRPLLPVPAGARRAPGRSTARSTASSASSSAISARSSTWSSSPTSRRPASAASRPPSSATRRRRSAKR